MKMGAYVRKKVVEMDIVAYHMYFDGHPYASVSIIKNRFHKRLGYYLTRHDLPFDGEDDALKAISDFMCSHGFDVKPDAVHLVDELVRYEPYY